MGFITITGLFPSRPERGWSFCGAHEFEDYLKTWVSYYKMETRWPESTFWKRRHNFKAPIIENCNQTVAGELAFKDA